MIIRTGSLALTPIRYDITLPSPDLSQEWENSRSFARDPYTIHQGSKIWINQLREILALI